MAAIAIWNLEISLSLLLFLRFIFQNSVILFLCFPAGISDIAQREILVTMVLLLLCLPAGKGSVAVLSYRGIFLKCY